MSNLQSDQPTFRAGHYAFDGFLCTPSETVIFSRAVNMASIPDPLTAITFDDPYSGSGAYTDVVEDAEIIVYAGNTSTVRGRLRVAYGGASSTVIQVNEVGDGRIPIENNDRFDVVESYRLRDKLVAASATFDKDSRRAYVDEGETQPPVIVVGCGAAGFVDPATGLLTVVFQANQSYPIDVNNAGGLDYLWDVADGTITVGTTTTSGITVTFEADTISFRYVTLTVTDADNGASTVRKIPVWSFDGVNTLPIPVREYRAEGDKLGGWSATFGLSSDCDVDSLPEGAPVYYFEREYYDGVEGSYGGDVDGRENIKFVGYLRRETITINPDTDTLSIDAISPLQVLAELAGFSQALLDDNTPSSWQEDNFVSVRKIMWYVAHYHTTLDMLHDFLFDITVDLQYLEFFVQESVLLEQMRELARAVSAQFTCDRTGRFYVGRNLNRAPSYIRDMADTALALTARDLAAIPNLTFEHRYQYNSIEGRAFTTVGEPMLSVAPSEAPAEAPDQSTVESLIAPTQSDLNDITGWAWAELNSLYNGIAVPNGVEVTPHTSYDVVDPAHSQWLTLTLATSTNRRGRGFTGNRFTLRRVSIEADAETGIKNLSWIIDHETTGAPGTTREVPPPTSTEFPPYEYVPFNPGLPATFPGMISRAQADMAAICINGFYLTQTSFQTRASQGGPTWAFDQKPWDGTALLWVPNGFAYQAGTPAGWVITSTEIGYYVFSSGTYTSKHTFAVASIYRSVDASFSQSGFLAVVSYDGTQGTTCCYTTDNTTFAEVVINANTAALGDVVYNGCNISSKTNGRIIAGAATGLNTSAAYVSNSSGASWSLVSPAFPTSVWGFGTIANAWLNNPNDDTYYYARAKAYSYSSDQHGLFRRTAGSDVEISPVISGENYAPIDVTRYGIAISVLNADRLLTVGRAGGSTNYAVLLTNNARATSPTWIVVEAPGGNFRRCALSGNDASVGWVFGVLGAISQVTITGNTASLDSRTGNLASLSPGEVIGISGV